MVFNPALPRRSINSTLVATETTVFSFCSPSRGPTSTILTSSGTRIALHPENAKARRRHRRVARDGETAANHIARFNGRNHTVVPQPRTGVIGMTLRRILFSDLVRLLPLHFRSRFIADAGIAFDARKHLRR